MFAEDCNHTDLIENTISDEFLELALGRNKTGDLQGVVENLTGSCKRTCPNYCSQSKNWVPPTQFCEGKSILNFWKIATVTWMDVSSNFEQKFPWSLNRPVRPMSRLPRFDPIKLNFTVPFDHVTSTPIWDFHAQNTWENLCSTFLNLCLNQIILSNSYIFNQVT